MASVKIFGYATVVINFSGIGLPSDPEVGYRATALMVQDCQQAVGGKLLKWHYNPDEMKLYMIWEDRRDALFVAFNFRAVLAVIDQYFP